MQHMHILVHLGLYIVILGFSSILIGANTAKLYIKINLSDLKCEFKNGNVIII